VIMIKKTQSWRKFAVKAGIASILLVAAGTYINGRYILGFDGQKERCFPDYSVFLVDLTDKKIERGEVFTFKSREIAPIFSKNQKVVKILAGLPGDFIEVTPEETKINGNVVATGMKLTDVLKVNADDFAREMVIPDNKYFFVGVADNSFDSRYWGFVNEEQIIGRSYPLF